MKCECYSNNAKLIALLLVIVVLTACGGGRATTSSNESKHSDDTSPSTSAGSDSATISWLAPTSYVDGTTISELSGHNIYINSGSGYTKLTSINNPSVTTYIVENLQPGIYKIVVTAFDAQGVESAYSSEVSLTISS